MPVLPWLCSLLQAVGQPPTSVLFGLAGGLRVAGQANLEEPIARAFVLLTTDGAQYQHGPLTHWSREAETMNDYHQHPTDAYTMKVVETFGCHESLSRRCKRGRGEVNMSYVRPLSIPCWSQEAGDGADVPLLTRADGSQVRVQDVLRDAGLNKTWTACYSLLCPKPIVELIIHGAWSELMFLTRWHPLNSHGKLLEWIPNWPPSDCLTVWGKGQVLQEYSSVKASACDELRKDILKWVPHILRADPSQKAALETHVLMLESWANALKGKSGKPLGRLKHSAEKLIATIKAADYIKNYKKLTDICEDLLPHLARGISQDVSPSHILPSRTQIRFYELVFDLALMLTRRTTAYHFSRATYYGKYRPVIIFFVLLLEPLCKFKFIQRQ